VGLRERPHQELRRPLVRRMRADRVRAAWTTNFDAMIEDGVAQIFGTRRFGLAVVGYSGRDRSV
jgi:hypothetical protein